MAYAILAKLLTGHTPPGWASLTTLMIFIGGIQLLVMGIVGEYLGRIFEEVKRRPHFIRAGSAGWLSLELVDVGRQVDG